MFSLENMRFKARNSALVLQVAVLVAAGLSPLLSLSTADAAQLTSRKVTISTSEAAATGVTYQFDYTIPTAATVQSMVYSFCTTPLGACVLPNTMDISAGTADAQTFSEAATFTKFTGAATGDCANHLTASAYQFCATRTAGANETATAKSFTIGTVTNPTPPSGNNVTVYVRVALYSGTTFTPGNLVHDGTVAASINRQLTVNGRVQERLVFCVAAVADGGASDTTLPTDANSCGALTNTIVDLGVLDNTSINKAPVPNSTAKQGNDNYGIAMLNTNASNGVSVTYFAEPDTTPGATNELRAFRVPGATCNVSGTSITDQCFQSAAAASTTFVAGTENFGVNVPCVIGGGTNGTPVVSTTTNIVVPVAYSNTDATTTSSADCEKTDAGVKFAWNTTASAVQIASSPSVVDNELIKLSFGATAAATTPTGGYTVQSTYIATPTF